MPSLTRRRDASGSLISADALYEALVSMAHSDYGAVRESDVVRGSHPAVKLSPEYFVAVAQGLDSDEKHALRLRATKGDH